VAIYDDRTDDPRAMFAAARWVLKGGRVIVRDGVVVDEPAGRRLRAAVEADEKGRAVLGEWHQRVASYDWGRVELSGAELAPMTAIGA
jgi:formylmethanofuran dehydrogenase subunit A